MGGAVAVSPGGQDWGAAVREFAQALHMRGYSRLTVRDYSSDVFRLAGITGVTPREISSEHLEAAERRAAGLALQTRRRRASAYSMFQAFMQSAPALESPAAVLLAPDSPLDADERLLAALTALAGLRLGEIRALEGRDVLLRQSLLRSRHGWRIVPLHPELQRVLEERDARCPLHSHRPVMMGPNGYCVHERTLHGRFQRMALRCGLQGLTPDGLRRASAAKLRALGTPPTLVRAFIGLERSEPLAPRSGRFADLSCVRERIGQLP